MYFTLLSMNKSNDNAKSKNDIYREKALAANVGLVMFLTLVIFGTMGTHPTAHAITIFDVLSAGAAFLAFLGLMALDVMNYRRADEMQQNLRLKAGAISFAAVIATALAAEILINLRVGTPKQYLQIIFIGGVVLWVITPMFLYYSKKK